MAKKPVKKSDRKAKQSARRKQKRSREIPKGAIHANVEEQAQPESMSARRFYKDITFVCRGCGEPGVWTAQQQKRYFEEQKGNTYNKPTWCTPCHRLRMDAKRQNRG